MFVKILCYVKMYSGRSVVLESLDSVFQTGIFDKVVLIVQLLRRYNIWFVERYLKHQHLFCGLRYYNLKNAARKI